MTWFLRERGLGKGLPFDLAHGLLSQMGQLPPSLAQSFWAYYGGTSRVKRRKEWGAESIEHSAKGRF
jgi:hypothetical protein